MGECVCCDTCVCCDCVCVRSGARSKSDSRSSAERARGVGDCVCVVLTLRRLSIALSFSRSLFVKADIGSFLSVKTGECVVGVCVTTGECVSLSVSVRDVGSEDEALKGKSCSELCAFSMRIVLISASLCLSVSHARSEPFVGVSVSVSVARS